MPRLAAAPLTHQLLTARLLVGLLKDKPDPLVHLDVFEREIMADVAALLVGADHAGGLEIRAQVREEMAAIAQLLRDGLRQLGA
jgi:di/tripeptidase